MEAGKAGKALDIVRTEVDLNELVGDLHMIIEAMLGRNGEVNLQPPEVYCCPCRVLCDTDRVRGILLNLYSNAAKFTKQGDIALKPPAAYCCPYCVLCDTDRVRGILLNLYSNATKFTKQGDIALKCNTDRVRGILLNLYSNAAKFTKHGDIALNVREVGMDYVPQPPEGYSQVREVGMDYVPQPPEGYSQVTSTPAYQLLKYPDSGPQMPINPLSTSPSLGNLSDLGALRTRPGSTDFGTTGPAPAMVQIISPAVTAPPLDPVSEVDLGRSFHDYDDADRVRGSKEYTQGKGLPLNGGTTEEELLESPWSPSFPNVGMSTEMSLEDSVMASEKYSNLDKLMPRSETWMTDLPTSTTSSVKNLESMLACTRVGIRYLMSLL
eukprot:gene26868-4475_t